MTGRKKTSRKTSKRPAAKAKSAESASPPDTSDGLLNELCNEDEAPPSSDALSDAKTLAPVADAEPATARKGPVDVEPTLGEFAFQAGDDDIDEVADTGEHLSYDEVDDTDEELQPLTADANRMAEGELERSASAEEVVGAPPVIDAELRDAAEEVEEILDDLEGIELIDSDEVSDRDRPRSDEDRDDSPAYEVEDQTVKLVKGEEGLLSDVGESTSAVDFRAAARPVSQLPMSASEEVAAAASLELPHSASIEPPPEDDISVESATPLLPDAEGEPSGASSGEEGPADLPYKTELTPPPEEVAEALSSRALDALEPLEEPPSDLLPTLSPVSSTSMDEADLVDIEDVVDVADIEDLTASENLTGIEVADAAEQDGLTERKSLLSDDEVRISVNEQPESVELGEEDSTEVLVKVEPGTDAVVALMQRGERDAWAERAEWLYQEAPPEEDGKARARALVVVAELFLMAGEDDRAKELIQEALTLAPDWPLAHRLNRSFGMAQGDWSTVCESFDDEARVAQTQEAKAHAYGVAGQIKRLIEPSDEAYRVCFEHAQRAQPEDVRPHLAQLGDTLAKSDEIPSPLELPASLAKLAAAVSSLRILRSDGVEVDERERDAFESMLLARAALRRRDVAQALKALTEVEQQSELAAGAAWLQSALSAPHREFREASIAALGRVAEGSHGSLAKRALAARALETGSEQKAVEVARTAGEAVLSSADRIALIALSGTSCEEVSGWMTDASRDEDYGPLAFAGGAFLRSVGDSDVVSHQVGQVRLRAEAHLGRQLANHACRTSSAESEDLGLVSDAAHELLRAAPKHGGARAVLLEHAYATHQVHEVEERLLLEGQVESLGPQRALARALFAELLGEHEACQGHLLRVLESHPEHDGAVRMSLKNTDAVSAASNLRTHAEAVDDVMASSVAYCEAGLRLLAEAEHDAEGLLRRAFEASSECSLASFLGLQGAQGRGDVASSQYWFGQRQAAAETDADIVSDLLREALAIHEAGSSERKELLARAHRAFAGDYSVRDLYERSEPEADDRSEWLLSHARKQGAEAGPLACEAALSYELSDKLELASEAAKLATDAEGGSLAVAIAARVAARGHGADEHVDALNEQLRTENDVKSRLELSWQLARIEAARGDRAAELSALREGLKADPTDLFCLYRMASLTWGGEDLEAIEQLAMTTSRAVDDGEAVAHLMLVARCRQRQQRLKELGEVAQLIRERMPTHLWAMRELAAAVRSSGDHLAAVSIDYDLANENDQAMDRATLLVRAAESSLLAGDNATAGELLSEVLEVWPEHPVALLHQARLLEATGATVEAAQVYDQLAHICQSPRYRLTHLHHAATLFLALEDEEGQEMGRRLLEAVVELDVSYKDAFEWLQTIYVAKGAKRELAALLGAKLRSVEDPVERLELEVKRGKILSETGAAAEAKAALAAALAASPDNQGALEAFADVCMTEQDWLSAEQALIRLGRLATVKERQVDVYVRLGQLYDGPLDNAERAERAYQEVLRLDANNVKAREKLVALYLSLGNGSAALEHQEALVDSVEDDDAKCAIAVRLAIIYEQAGDIDQAEQLLVNARRQFSRQAGPLVALVELYRRHNKGPAADMLLGRAAADVRRGLGAGRFEPALFTMTVSVAELRGQHDGARVAEATRALIEGNSTALTGVGTAVASEDLDDLLAPDIFQESFRILLARTGVILDAAVPMGLDSLRVKQLVSRGGTVKLRHAKIIDVVSNIATAYGINDIAIYESNALGHVCVPVSVEPPVLVLGKPLIDSDHEEAREFLIYRAMKALQTRTAALARTAPIDLWPLLAAYLKIHCSHFEPSGVDPGKFNAFYRRLSEVASGTDDPNLNLVATEVIGYIGNRASSLNTAANSWGARSALLAMGDPGVAMDAISWAAGSTEGLPPAGPERIRWIGRHAEARDLVIFSVSDNYRKLRQRFVT